MQLIELPRRPGLYVVTLANDEPIPVQANRPGQAKACIAVTRANCKFGKTENLHRRRREYFRTFGEENVRFHVVAMFERPGAVEPLVAAILHRYRLRGRSNRLHEWLQGISAQEVEHAVLAALDASGLSFERPYSAAHTG